MIFKNKYAAEDMTIAYFSMEIGLDPAMPTYAGGLGVLAGDTLRAAADHGLPMVGVTLLYRKGYFRQHLDEHGNQSEGPYEWSPEKFLELLPTRATITIEGRQVHLRAWRYIVHGLSGFSLPVFFLDTGLPENDPWDQLLTDYLYGGENRYRLCQEVLLGIGGVTMLRALRYEDPIIYHKNEGHAALLALALLEEQTGARGLHSATHEDIEAVRRECVFTTHTPVPAGHDQFPIDLVRTVLGNERTAAIESVGCCPQGILNMTFMSLFFSYYINGVSMRHEELSQTMFPNYPVNSITNGVHACSWVCPHFSDLFDRHIPEWRHDNLYLRYAIYIPLDEILEAHAKAKHELLKEVERRSGKSLDRKGFTIGFARRATQYKRGDLLFTDMNRLRRFVSNVGPLQLIYAGKAHPKDEGGKTLIRNIFKAGASLAGTVSVVYLEEYDMELARYLCAGADLWLNTPHKPYEASGTSGMKAALNGVPSLSVLDGWWIEGHVEGVTGWSVGESWEADTDRSQEVLSLYDKLEFLIGPMFYERPEVFARVMRSAISLNASFFNSQRMVSQYMGNAYDRSRLIQVVEKK